MEAVVFDLDGTLLSSNKLLSSRNKKSIEQLLRHEIPIIIATARPPRAVKYLLPPDIQSQVVMVYYNGAMIVSEQLGIHQHFPIDSTVSNEIIDYLIEEEAPHWLSIEVEDKWYCYQELDYKTVMKVRSNPEKIDLHNLKQKSPTKMLVSNLLSYDFFNKRFGSKVNMIQTDSNQLTQIMRLNTSKEYAINVVSEHLNISLNKIVVFGDDFNDLGMFHLCGYPVAMGNAVDELKNAAKEVTDTNDNDGVAKTLEALFKKSLIKN
ncbi:HAD family hydrolase [Bacillus sp. ISL-41]|uniref:HAD family hydrolase n=1 Tax=Bacillus sp. ISL-41 TaxID=2819127 RepID=UPI001BE969DC|nr:HAD family hydrolase [Bacillus sp. ISL-41]MBT2642907.1 HAD family hydrolase [Bacillus sp. ISL-41]